MNNMRCKIVGNELTIRVDLSQKGELTKKGTSRIVAGTNFYEKLDLPGYSISMVVLRNNKVNVPQEPEAKPAPKATVKPAAKPAKPATKKAAAKKAATKPAPKPARATRKAAAEPVEEDADISHMLVDETPAPAVKPTRRRAA